MIYISKKIEKKIYYRLIKDRSFSFSFLNFVLRNKKRKFFKKYLVEVGLLKKIDK
jgi:hypothetical protein